MSDSKDYQFNDAANLFFKSSHESFGVQIADIIAGFVMRFIDQKLKAEPVEDAVLDAHKLLRTLNREEVGIGINMVMSARDANQIQVSARNT